MQKIYETERLILKVLDKTYASLVLDYYSRNKLFLEPWEPLRVVEKLDFYNESLACKYLKINGQWEDHIHMILLNNNL